MPMTFDTTMTPENLAAFLRKCEVHFLRSLTRILLMLSLASFARVETRAFGFISCRLLYLLYRCKMVKKGKRTEYKQPVKRTFKLLTNWFFMATSYDAHGSRMVPPYWTNRPLFSLHIFFSLEDIDTKRTDYCLLQTLAN
jgi:hypothetical protein